MNQEGYLVTKDGDYVLGEGGNPIQLPTDVSQLTVDSTEFVYYLSLRLLRPVGSIRR